jgi:DNA-binding MarR family transcriptional regulator
LARPEPGQSSTVDTIDESARNLNCLCEERQKNDNRSVLVSMTRKGRRTAQVCWQAVQTHHARITEGLDGAGKSER